MLRPDGEAFHRIPRSPSEHLNLSHEGLLVADAVFRKVRRIIEFAADAGFKCCREPKCSFCANAISVGNIRVSWNNHEYSRTTFKPHGETHARLAHIWLIEYETFNRYLFTNLFCECRIGNENRCVHAKNSDPSCKQCDGNEHSLRDPSIQYRKQEHRNCAQQQKTDERESERSNRAKKHSRDEACNDRPHQARAHYPFGLSSFSRWNTLKAKYTTSARIKKLISAEIKSPTLKLPIVYWVSVSVLRKSPIRGLIISSMSACMNFCAAPPKIKPMANPATPRSRIKSTNPASVPFICSRTIPLLCTVDCFVYKPIRFFVLLTRHVDESNVRKMRDEEIMHLHVLRP